MLQKVQKCCSHRRYQLQDKWRRNSRITSDPNGAGKSTTMNMITGYIEPTAGEIIVDGYNIDKSLKKQKEIGYMPEGVPLYTDLTVKEFITYMASIKR